MPYTKIPFYFRSREQMQSVYAFAGKVDEDASPKYRLPRRGVFDPAYIIVESAVWNRQATNRKMPVSKPGKKKYIGTLNVAGDLMEAYPTLEEDFFTEADVVPIPKPDTTPKYSEDEITRTTIRLKNVKHFRKVTSVLNKEYGHGNWHFRGARKIISKLRKAENWLEHGNSMFGTQATPEIKEIARKGLKVDVVVTDKVTNLRPLLFKVQLMS